MSDPYSHLPIRQLPNEAKLFASIDKTWRDIMRRTMDNPNALSAATSTGLLDVLQACNSNLEKIHKSLEVMKIQESLFHGFERIINFFEF